jgi:eukaryotic-like serine/threonine-protein kinase
MTDSVPRLTTALADRYRIERELGVGGMATVYLAHDLKHDRKVAIKVLRPELSAVLGSGRFLAEIRTTANLQHPHILPLHDSGEVDGTVFYVMPFVTGESLRDRLTREKQLPIPDAVRIAQEVAGALDYAHRQGVIHRDIKPENILLHDGRALVADFGIALAASSAGGSRMTETGMSLGTPTYMSPEQAMGERNLDARTDVYALGCVLYEMLTGDPPFTGSTAQAIIAKVMTERPTAPSAVRDTVPESVENAVLTALAKLPADRFASAAQFAAAVAAGGDTARHRARRPGGVAAAGPQRFVWPVASLLALGGALWGWLRPSPAALPPSRLALLAPSLGGASTALMRQLALTPDGSTVLYTAVTPDGGNRTMSQGLDEAAPTILPGLVQFLADYIVAPDGREFLASSREGQQMFRFPIGGGTGQPLPREIRWTSYTVWGADGTIWFSDPDARIGFTRLGADGRLTHPFAADGGLLLMQLLPDGRFALAVREPQGVASGPVVLLDLRSGATTMLMDLPVVEARYTAGYLLYVPSDGTLHAVPFDPASRHLSGTAVQIGSGVSLTGSGLAQLAVAPTGTVAYIPEEPRSLVLVTRDGGSRLATEEKRNFHAPRFSPDGRRISTDFTAADGRDVWVLNLDGAVLTRATFDRGGHDATWTPDGRSLTFGTLHDGVFGLFRTRLGSAEPAESLLTSARLAYTGLWLPDGNTMVTAAASLQPGSGGDIALVRNGGRGPIEPLVATQFEEAYPAVSRDGRWLAFASNQSGKNEVYVRPLGRAGDQVQVSAEGGTEPVWGPDGRELFYRSSGTSPQLIVATIQSLPTFTVTSRRPLFPVSDIVTASPHSNYDVSPDGKRFVMVRLNPSSRIMIIQNLPALVRKISGTTQGTP